MYSENVWRKFFSVELIASSDRGVLLRRQVILMLLALMVFCPSLARACPFCSALAPTLSDDLKQSSAAVIVHCESSSTGKDALQLCRMRIDEVVKGDPKLLNSTIEVTTAQELAEKQVFWLVGYGEDSILWGTPKRCSTTAIPYFRGLNGLPNQGPKRLEYFLKFLQHADELVSADAYNEFADASLEEIVCLREKLDRRWVLRQLREVSVPVHRRRLCWTLLSQCGVDSDIELFDELLGRKQVDPTFDLGMDAAISCLISLGGQRALARIERDYLANPEVDYLDCFAAVNAIRVHGTELKVIPRERLAAALKHVLNQKELADLVISDLARWEDWSAIDRVVELFEESTNDANSVKPKVVLYLKTCPLPNATEALDKLRKIDAKAVERAEASMRFYPGLATVPVPPPAVPPPAIPSPDRRTSGATVGESTNRRAILPIDK